MVAGPRQLQDEIGTDHDIVVLKRSLRKCVLIAAFAMLNLNAIETWNPFRASSPWDPIRKLEEMQNRLALLFGRRLPLPRNGGEEEFTVTEWALLLLPIEPDAEFGAKVSSNSRFLLQDLKELFAP